MIFGHQISNLLKMMSWEELSPRQGPPRASEFLGLVLRGRRGALSPVAATDHVAVSLLPLASRAGGNRGNDSGGFGALGAFRL